MTNYFGEADGHKATRGEELVYLRSFKKKNRLPYGFAIADSSVNDLNYGVFTIPMSFLIDRQGRIRYISMGASADEIAALGKMLEKVMDEPAGAPAATATVNRIPRNKNKSNRSAIRSRMQWIQTSPF